MWDVISAFWLQHAPVLSVLLPAAVYVFAVVFLLYAPLLMIRDGERNGQTLGKQVLKMRVYGASGGNPTMEEALRRNAWAFSAPAVNAED